MDTVLPNRQSSAKGGFDPNSMFAAADEVGILMCMHVYIHRKLKTTLATIFLSVPVCPHS